MLKLMLILSFVKNVVNNSKKMCAPVQIVLEFFCYNGDEGWVEMCVTAMGIAMFVVLSYCIQVPVFENYYLCLLYFVTIMDQSEV